MKILVIQITRFGDIYLSWPSIRSLRRNFPDAEIHFLIRNRFKDAAIGLEEIDKIKFLDPTPALKHCLDGQVEIGKALNEIEGILEELCSEKYSWVINLSFSPVSSFITHRLAKDSSAVVRGLTRHPDGYLAIPDDESAFVHAQAGTSRIHLTETFAGIMGLSLETSDWKYPNVCLNKPTQIPWSKYVVIHVGASESNKRIDTAFLGLIGRRVKDPVVLIGSGEEIDSAQKIEGLIPFAKVVNLVGNTKITELFGVLRHAQYLIGADSAPIHMASLVGTPILNLALGNVNFWETGPRSPNSAVIDLRKTGPNLDLVDEVIEQIERRDLKPQKNVYVSTFSIPCFETFEPHIPLKWALQKYIYLSGDFPDPSSDRVVEVLKKVYEVNEIAISTIKRVSSKEQKVELGILDRCDELFQALVKLEPEIMPLVQWYLTEKIRIGPGAFSEIQEDSLRVHENLQDLVWGILHQGDLHAV